MNILIRLPNWVGDVVMSVPFIAAVKKLYPQSQIDVIIKEGTEDLLCFSSDINEVFVFSKKKHRGLWGGYQFAKAIKRKKIYTLFFCLPNSFSSAWIGFFVSAKTRIGYANEGRSWMLSNRYKKPKKVHRSEEYLHLLHRFSPDATINSSFFFDSTYTQKEKNYIEGFPKKGKTLLVNIYSEARSRTMPLSLAKQLIALFHSQYKYNIILCGQEKNKANSQQLVKDLPATIPIYDYTGKTNMQSLCELIAKVDYLVSIDSGIAHIGNAIGIPTLILFGAGNEDNTAPLIKKNLVTVRKQYMTCAPCLSNTCKYGTPICLSEMHPTNILNAFAALLKKSCT